MLSRRRLLLGAGALAVAGGAAVFLDTPVMRDDAHALQHPDPTPTHTVPPTHPVPRTPVDAVGEIVSGSFASKAMHNPTGWSIAYPAGSPAGTPLPVLLELHGSSDDHRDSFGSHRLGDYLSAAVRSGVPPFAIASVDGRDHSYWHPRDTGEDPQAMILNELLPLLAARGLKTERLALGGWSMGGYGALLLAERLGRSRVAAVAVDSPGLWATLEDAPGDAFDGPKDFAAHDVLAHTGALAGIPVRVSCGTSDSLISGVHTLLERLPSAEHDLGPGGHNVGWWRRAAPGQLAFVGRHLAA